MGRPGKRLAELFLEEDVVAPLVRDVGPLVPGMELAEARVDENPGALG